MTFWVQAQRYLAALKEQLSIGSGKWERQAIWQKSVWYWRRRQQLERLRFAARRRRYLVRRGARERTTTFYVILQILRAIFGAALAAALFVAGLTSFELILHRWWPGRLAIENWSTSLAGDQLAVLGGVYGTVLQVTGVF